MIGLRIKHARLAVGATLEELATELSRAGFAITKAGLSKYETGKSVPPQTFMIGLAKALKVKPSFFISQPTCTVTWHAFRKQAKLPQKLQEHVMASAERTIESQIWLIETLSSGKSAVNFPPPVRVKDFDDVERSAVKLRECWGIKNRSIGRLVALAESNGIVVVDHIGIERDRQFDGLSGWANKSIPVVVISTNSPDDRIRYTAAHELGHLTMNCGSCSEAKEESFAHRFASAFIVPADAMRSELGSKRRNVSLREFAVLKQKYGLSMQGLVRRALDLDIISQAHYSALFRQFGSLGWRKKEPVEFKSDERPTHLLQMTLRAVSEGIISADKAEQFNPGCLKADSVKTTKVSPRQLRAMPNDARVAILEAAANSAQCDYIHDKQLTDFEAFDEDGLNE